MYLGATEEDAKVVKQLLTSVGLCEQVPEYQQVWNTSKDNVFQEWPIFKPDHQQILKFPLLLKVGT